MADELERRGGVRMRGAIHTILQDQVLLGERLGLAVVPRRAERVRDVVWTSRVKIDRSFGVEGARCAI